jgi:hypothetical protein
VERSNPWIPRALVIFFALLFLGRLFPEIGVWVSVPTGVIAAMFTSVAGLVLILWFALKAIETLKPMASQHRGELQSGLFGVVAGLISGLTTDAAGLEGPKALIPAATVVAIVLLGIFAAQTAGQRLRRVVYLCMGIGLPAIPAASVIAAGRTAELQAVLREAGIATYAMFLVFVVVVVLGLYVSADGSTRSTR